MAQDPNASKEATATDEPTATDKPTTGTDEAKVTDESTEQKQSSSDKLKDKLSLFGKKAKAAGQKAKESAIKAKEELDARLTMQGQLKAARESLGKFLSPKLDVEKQIPIELMKNAQGIVFLSSIKASFGFGASIGAGVIITKLEYGAGWSGPCSIGLLGGQWGFNLGAQKTDFIIILRDEKAVKLFSGKGQIKFGADASIAAGPIGRDANLAVGANDKGYAATMSYSMAKGLYVGIALEGQGIAVRNDCNEKYYGKKLEVKDILATGGDGIKNEDYDGICEMLTNYTSDMDQKAAKNVDVEGDNDSKQPL
eukprot:224630_1